MFRAFLILSGWVFACPVAACETALILAVDVSGSVDNSELALQMEGLARAFEDPDIAQAIVAGNVAVALVQWSGRDVQDLTLPWQSPQTGAEVAELAATIRKIGRPANYTGTAIGEAIRFSMAQFAAVPDCRRHVIDVSGDGPENDRNALPAARAEAQAAGVTLNGLAIEADASATDLTAYYRRSVATPDGFVITAHGTSDFPRAILLKLTRELVEPLS